MKYFALLALVLLIPTVFFAPDYDVTPLYWIIGICAIVGLTRMVFGPRSHADDRRTRHRHPPADQQDEPDPAPPPPLDADGHLPPNQQAPRRGSARSP